MKVETAQSFFLWCTVINFGILLLWSLVFKLAHDWHYRMTSKWFRVSVEQYDLLIFWGVTLFKVAILVFSLVPYLALCIVRQ